MIDRGKMSIHVTDLPPPQAPRTAIARSMLPVQSTLASTLVPQLEMDFEVHPTPSPPLVLGTCRSPRLRNRRRRSWWALRRPFVV